MGVYKKKESYDLPADDGNCVNGGQAATNGFAIATNGSQTFTTSTQKVYVGGAEEFGNFRLKNEKLVRHKGGLSWFVASLFLLADMAGGGIVAMPTAIVHSSFYVGLCVLLLFAAMATISSVLLGRAWLILLRRHPEYRTHCRKPYAEMGYRALGPAMMRFASGCVNFTQFGASVVFLLLSAKNINDFLWTAVEVDVGQCLMVIILALLLLPITLLKSPQDFWPVIILGMLSTFVAVALVCVGAWNDHACYKQQSEQEFRALNVFANLGTVLFSFGGHSAFPTIQHDMRRPADFDKSSYFGFIVITVINIVVVLFGGLTYGSSLGDSVINSIQTVWIRQAINLMISAHCLLTVTLIINPLNQEVEETFNVPQVFSLRRVLVRSGMMAIVVFTAETLPSFGSVMDLMGGSTVTLTSLVFPCLFYLFLAAGERKSHEANGAVTDGSGGGGGDKADLGPIGVTGMLQRTRPLTLLACGFVCVVGTVAGIAATVSAVRALFESGSDRFVAPCYVSVFMRSAAAVGGASNDTFTVLNCCGERRDVSLFGGVCRKSP